MATPLLDQMKKDLLKDSSHVKRWLKRTDNFSWCAAQTAYAASRAGLLEKEITKSTWAWKQAEFMRVRGRLYKYQDVKNQLRPDCVMFFNKNKSDYRIDHVSIFERYNNTKTQMLTVGGNEPDWSGSVTSSLRRVRQNYTRLTSDNPFFVGYPSYLSKPNARAYMGPLATDKQPHIKPTNDYEPLPTPPPAANAKYPLIVLNPGHVDGDKRGFVGSETEGGNNRKTVAVIKDYLESKYECRVQVVQQNSTPFEKLGSAYPDAVLFYSHHTNAFNDPSAKGVEVFYYYGKTLAQNIAISTSKILKTVVRGSMNGAKRNSDQFNGAGYAVLNQSQRAGVKHGLMGEIGFHSNPSEAKIMVEKRKEIGEAIAKEMGAYLKLKSKPKPPVSEPEISPEKPKDPEKPPSEPVEETPPVINPNPPAPEPDPGPDPEEPDEPYVPPEEPIPETPEEKEDPVRGPYEKDGQKLWFRIIVQPFHSKEEIHVFIQKLRYLGFYGVWYQTKERDGKEYFEIVIGTKPSLTQAEALMVELREEGVKSAEVYSLTLPVSRL